MKKGLLALTCLFGLAACEQQSPLLGLKGTKIPFERYAHCNTFVPDGFPQHAYKERNTYFICQDHYVLELNPYTGNAMWLAEHLNGKMLTKYKDAENRTPTADGGQDKGFRHTPTFPYFLGEATSSIVERFKKEGFVPYQLASLDNWKGNDKAQTQTYYYTNVFPAFADNVELFQNTEKLIRQAIEKAGEGFVFTGAIYSGEPNNLGSFGLNIEDERGFIEKKIKGENRKGLQGSPKYLIPTHLYKMVYIPSTKQTAVFILPNSATKSKEPRSFVSNLKQLEKMTSINFFPVNGLNPPEKK